MLKATAIVVCVWICLISADAQSCPRISNVAELCVPGEYSAARVLIDMSTYKPGSSCSCTYNTSANILRAVTYNAPNYQQCNSAVRMDPFEGSTVKFQCLVSGTYLDTSLSKSGLVTMETIGDQYDPNYCLVLQHGGAVSDSVSVTCTGPEETFDVTTTVSSATSTSAPEITTYESNTTSLASSTASSPSSSSSSVKPIVTSSLTTTDTTSTQIKEINATTESTMATQDQRFETTETTASSNDAQATAPETAQPGMTTSTGTPASSSSRSSITAQDLSVKFPSQTEQNYTLNNTIETGTQTLQSSPVETLKLGNTVVTGRDEPLFMSSTGSVASRTDPYPHTTQMTTDSHRIQFISGSSRSSVRGTTTGRPLESSSSYTEAHSTSTPETATVSEAVAVPEIATVSETKAVSETSTVSETTTPVSETATVSEAAAVSETATVFETVGAVNETATVSESTTVSETATVSEATSVYETATVSEATGVSETATVSEATGVSENTTVSEATGTVQETATEYETATMFETEVRSATDTVPETAIVSETATVSETVKVPETSVVFETVTVPDTAIVSETSTLSESVTVTMAVPKTVTVPDNIAVQENAAQNPIGTTEIDTFATVGETDSPITDNSSSIVTSSESDFVTSHTSNQAATTVRLESTTESTTTQFSQFNTEPSDTDAPTKYITTISSLSTVSPWVTEARLNEVSRTTPNTGSDQTKWFSTNTDNVWDNFQSLHTQNNKTIHEATESVITSSSGPTTKNPSNNQSLLGSILGTAFDIDSQMSDKQTTTTYTDSTLGSTDSFTSLLTTKKSPMTSDHYQTEQITGAWSKVPELQATTVISESNVNQWQVTSPVPLGPEGSTFSVSHSDAFSKSLEHITTDEVTQLIETDKAMAKDMVIPTSTASDISTDRMHSDVFSTPIDKVSIVSVVPSTEDPNIDESILFAESTNHADTVAPAVTIEQVETTEPAIVEDVMVVQTGGLLNSEPKVWQQSTTAKPGEEHTDTVDVFSTQPSVSELTTLSTGIVEEPMTVEAVQDLNIQPEKTVQHTTTIKTVDESVNVESAEVMVTKPQATELPPKTTITTTTAAAVPVDEKMKVETVAVVREEPRQIDVQSTTLKPRVMVGVVDKGLYDASAPADDQDTMNVAFDDQSQSFFDMNNNKYIIVVGCIAGLVVVAVIIGIIINHTRKRRSEKVDITTTSGNGATSQSRPESQELDNEVFEPETPTGKGANITTSNDTTNGNGTV